MRTKQFQIQGLWCSTAILKWKFLSNRSRHSSESNKNIWKVPWGVFGLNCCLLGCQVAGIPLVGKAKQLPPHTLIQCTRGWARAFRLSTIAGIPLGGKAKQLPSPSNLIQRTRGGHALLGCQVAGIQLCGKAKQLPPILIQCTRGEHAL